MAYALDYIVEMDSNEIVELRRRLGLTQAEFGQLFGAHGMTVSKWERGVLMPTSYQAALMDQFDRTAQQRADPSEQVKKLLVGAGVVAALVWLLGSGK